MYSLLALYIGFTIYLIIFLRFKKTDNLARKITIFLTLKLAILTIIYFMFFSEKMTKEQRQKNIETIITH
jgi:glucan phosphoethanolaminetransferase (alkaline phosphatase superfamily)